MILQQFMSVQFLPKSFKTLASERSISQKLVDLQSIGIRINATVALYSSCSLLLVRQKINSIGI